MRRWIGCCLLLFLSLPLLAQKPPQFSADVKMTGTGAQPLSTGKVFFGGEKVRIEMNAQGHQAIMISDSAGKAAYMLMPEQHMYMDLSNLAGHQNRPDWRAYDAANPCLGMADTTCRKAGTEVVDGRSCDKWQFTEKGKTASDRTVWIDQKSGIPVKTAMSNGNILELTNIKEAPQSASLFEIPEGYQKFDMGDIMRGMKPPQ
jgi:outer membrane lipoprotein-sorting protein